jgi:hypothetical protein
MGILEKLTEWPRRFSLPVAAAIGLRRSKSRHFRFGAKTNRPEVLSNRPGRLIPMPSIFLLRAACAIRWMDWINSSTAFPGFGEVAITSCEVKLPFTSASATVV